MSLKTIAISAACVLGLNTTAYADVVQNVTAVQQSDQLQYADGLDVVEQNVDSYQRLDQRSLARDYQESFIQQTVTGAQTNVQTQDAIGGSRVRQGSISDTDVYQEVRFERLERRERNDDDGGHGGHHGDDDD